MTRCLLCGFDSKDKTGHGQVSCDLRHLPWCRTLPAGNPFKRHAASCSDLACVCKMTWPTCTIIGHNNRTLVVTGAHFSSGAGGRILRKEGASPLCGADLVCHEIKDLHASGFVKAVLANYQKKFDDSARLAGATEELIRNTSRSGLYPSAAMARMGEMGMKADTLDPSNRAHFEEAFRLLQNPAVSAVNAAHGACGVLVGLPGESPWASTSSGQSASGGSAPGVAVAAARAAQGAVVSVTDGTLAAPTRVAGHRVGDQGGTCGPSLKSAHALFVSNNKSMQQSGLGTAGRLSLLPSSSPCVRPGSASAAAGPGSGLGSSAGASSVADAVSPFDWPRGERCKNDSSLGVFERPELSATTAAELATAAHRGSPGEAMASKLPELKDNFIKGAETNMLLGVMMACGVVSPARLAKQLCSIRTEKPQSNLLMMLANWMVKIRSEAVAAAELEVK